MMPKFPQQVPHERILTEIKNFYEGVDKHIREVFKKINRKTISNRNTINETDVEDLSELDHNRRMFRQVFQDLRMGKPRVTVKWYEPEIQNAANPTWSASVKEFQLEYRYGKWFKHDTNLMNWS